MELDENRRRKAVEKAETLSGEFDPKEAETFARKHRDSAWYEDFMLLYEMVTDRDYRIDRSTYLAIAGALAYVVLPIDVIPDFIPGVGFVDDVFVLGWVMKSLSDEVQRYRCYKDKGGEGC